MKLSKHPVGTFIHLEGVGHFEKIANGFWRHADGTANYLTKQYVRNIEKTEPERIKILAAPWSVVVELMTMVMEEYGFRDAEGNPITFDSIYKDAITRERETQKVEDLQNYCVADAEVIQQFSDHILRPSEIFKMRMSNGKA